MSASYQPNEQDTPGNAAVEHFANQSTSEYTVEDEINLEEYLEYAVSPTIPEQINYSGFFEAEDTTNLSRGSNYSDWTLYERHLYANEDDCFADEDAVDISSVKANHGSIYAGCSNETDVENQPGTIYTPPPTARRSNAIYNTAGQTAHTAMELYPILESTAPEQSQYSVNFQDRDRQVGPTSLDFWMRSEEYHERLAEYSGECLWIVRQELQQGHSYEDATPPQNNDQ